MRIYLFLLAYLCAFMHTDAYAGCIKGNCKNGEGTYVHLDAFKIVVGK